MGLGLHWVEGEALYWVDGVDAVYDLAVALERILLSLHFGGGVEELDSNASLNRSCGVTCTSE